MEPSKLIRDIANDETETIYIMKRSGTRCPFEPNKIRQAIQKANNAIAIQHEMLSPTQIDDIVTGIYKTAKNRKRDLSVEEIQDMVENAIMCYGKTTLARAYITYRYKHNENRMENTLDKRIIGMIEANNDDLKYENANKNPIILSVQRDYMAGEWSRHYTKKNLLPDNIQTANDLGILHFHDMDYFAQKEHNCCLINLNDMLQNGTCISDTPIDPPKSFATCCTVTSQIIAQVASMQYGGQSISLTHLAPFVDVSRRKIRNRLSAEMDSIGITYTDQQLESLVSAELLKEVKAGCQTIQYQLITLQTTNGQAPFVTVFMYLNEAPKGQLRDDLALLIKTMLEQRLQGVKGKSGAYVTPAFPKLIYVLQENNIHPGSEYYALTELAARCTAKRLVPDYISEKIMKELKGDVYTCMGCRSFLTPDRFTDTGIGNIAKALDYVPNQHKYYGRFNQGVVTLNLVHVACTSEQDEDAFWDILDKRLELCHRALRIRHERLLGTRSDIAPIQWQHGALARLEPGEVIDPLLYNGYSTISLGYAGLAECVYHMKGCSHTQNAGKEFALKVMQQLNDACCKWTAAENLDYSVYGTPLESTTYKFAKCLQHQFGKIPHVTDKNYITNSYHIRVTEEINAFDKITKEAEFQKLSPGGAISYVEVPDLTQNIQVILDILTHMYHTILYAELNTKSDYCDNCHYDGEIKIVPIDGRLGWECPCCHTQDTTKMHIARRTCGYIGLQYFNQGRTQEIAERVLHVSIPDATQPN